jgi:hypothetical protein
MARLVSIYLSWPVLADDELTFLWGRILADGSDL